MYRSISELIRNLVADVSEGDIIVKLNPVPKIKPSRKKPSFQNKSNRTDFPKNYMRKYREEGKDYQKIPEVIKKLRKKQRKKKEKKKQANIGIGLNTPAYEFNV